MKSLDINSITEHNFTSYKYDDIVIVDDISTIQHDSLKNTYINMVSLLFCLDGSAEVNMNETQYKIKKSDVLVCVPNSYIANYTLSKDFDAKIIIFSMDAIDSSVQISKNVWNSLYYINQNPVIHLNKKDATNLLYYYYIVENKLNHKTNPYYSEIMHSLLRCLIYEFLIITDTYSSKTLFEEEKGIKQADILFKRFLELLIREHGMIRSVSEAANRLNVSSKYLSATIKQTSKKTSLYFIHRYTMQEIIRRLKYTDKSIQEISNDMNFPSVSFFGKFFKQQTGMSPKQFRKNGGVNNSK